MDICLYENNAGHLYMTPEDASLPSYTGFEGLAPDTGGLFRVDAAALARGDTGNWTMEEVKDMASILEGPTPPALVATYHPDDDVVEIQHPFRLGAAAKDYIFGAKY